MAFSLTLLLRTIIIFRISNAFIAQLCERDTQPGGQCITSAWKLYDYRYQALGVVQAHYPPKKSNQHFSRDDLNKRLPAVMDAYARHYDNTHWNIRVNHAVAEGLQHNYMPIMNEISSWTNKDAIRFFVGSVEYIKQIQNTDKIYKYTILFSEADTRFTAPLELEFAQKLPVKGNPLAQALYDYPWDEVPSEQSNPGTKTSHMLQLIYQYNYASGKEEQKGTRRYKLIRFDGDDKTDKDPRKDEAPLEYCHAYIYPDGRDEKKTIAYIHEQQQQDLKRLKDGITRQDLYYERAEAAEKQKLGALPTSTGYKAPKMKKLKLKEEKSANLDS